MLKRSGEAVAENEVIAQIETDKVCAVGVLCVNVGVYCVLRGRGGKVVALLARARVAFLGFWFRQATAP